MKQPTSRAALQELRARAERQRLVTTSLLPTASAAEVQRLVQELQVHQIELEMQYEELLLTQAAAEASRAQYLDLYEFAPVGYCTLTANGTLSQLNPCTSQLLGQVRQQLLGRRLALFVDAAARAQFAEFMAQLWARPGERFTCELAMRRADDTLFFAQLEGRTVPEGDDESQPPTACHLVLLDVTERRRAADELAASEAHFRAAFEQRTDGMLLLKDQRFVSVNAAAARLLGCHDPQQLLGRAIIDFWPELQPDGRRSAAVLAESLAEAQRQGWCRLEWQRYSAAGQPVWDEMSFNPVLVGGQWLLHAAWRDVTARKRNEQRLQESEQRLSMALAASRTGIFTWDIADNQLHWDECSQAVFGQRYAAAPVPVEVLGQRFHPDDAARVWATMQAAVASGSPLALDYRVVWPDESVHYVSSAGQAIVDAQGQPSGFIGTLRDVTELYAAEEDLHYKTLVLERLLTNMPMILSRLRPDGQYLEAVGTGLRALGEADDTLVGRNVLTTYPSLRAAMLPVLGGAQAEFLAELEGKAGQPVAFHNYGFFDEQRQQAVVLAVDVTQAEQQKQQLRAEKDFSQSLLEHSVDGIVALDPTGCIRAWSSQATHYFGPVATPPVGQSIFAVLPFFDTPQVHETLARVLAGEIIACTDQAFAHLPGQYDVFHIPLRTAAEAEATGVLILFRDVTERNQLAEEATRLKLRQQQEVLSAILTTQEEERRRIAEALHNGLGQFLYGTRLHLDTLPPSPAVRASQDLLNEAIRMTRTISFELTPDILEDFGLAVGLEELVKRIPPSRLLVDLNLAGLETPLPKLLQIAVYRIVQELLNNVMKHAQAEEVFVQVSREEQLHISVEDDGVGFDPASPVSRDGIGLAGIRTRVNLLSGSLAIRSRVGQGTGIFLTLPIPVG